ncbi:MAG: class I SAM-dependent methyltransferase [Fusobacteriaceae bacterium]
MSIFNNEIIEIIKKSLEDKKFRKSVFSSALKGDIEKLNIKPILIKEKIFYQVEEFKERKAYHRNMEEREVFQYILEMGENFKNINIFSAEVELAIINNGKKLHVKKKNISQEGTLEIKKHNRDKKYIIPEGNPVPFLQDLGIMDGDGKVLKNSYSKFRQINRYLEFIRDVIDELKEKNSLGDKIKVVDFGSGKSYLTFVLYYYLKFIREMDVLVVGLDLKKDVMKHCAGLAEKYGFQDMKFIYGDIKDFNELESVDLVFSLHACNNATDYALQKGLEMNAKAILAVPCCHKEFNQKLSKVKKSPMEESLPLLLEHGILQEKFSSLLTESFRAGVLEMCGYRSTVMEFIDTEHTPKNLLIKAIRDKSVEKNFNKKQEQCLGLIKFAGIEPMFYDLMKPYFKGGA